MHKNVVRCMVSEIYCFSALPNNNRIFIYGADGFGWCLLGLYLFVQVCLDAFLAAAGDDRILVTEYNIIT